MRGSWIAPNAELASWGEGMLGMELVDGEDGDEGLGGFNGGNKGRAWGTAEILGMEGGDVEGGKEKGIVFMFCEGAVVGFCFVDLVGGEDFEVGSRSA